MSNRRFLRALKRAGFEIRDGARHVIARKGNCFFGVSYSRGDVPLGLLRRARQLGLVTP
jgi:hypothetical protein